MTITTAQFLLISVKQRQLTMARLYPAFNDEEKKKYEKKYPYLAPELKSGGGRQTVYTDVYSFGYLMKVVSHRLNDRTFCTVPLM